MGILNGNIPFKQLSFNDDGFPTETSIAQKKTEHTVLEKFVPYASNNVNKKDIDSIRLQRQKHIAYLKKGLLNGIGHWGATLDASKPWLIYWIFQSLDLLDFQLTPEITERCLSTFTHWQIPSGGFGGGSDQLAHLATTYAAVNALAISGSEEAYKILDREGLYEFLMRMKQPDGSFTMHEGGEIDIRGSYCALSAAALTNLLTPELTENCIDFICRSQTYEGGIGPYPGKEAHNGYTFCGLAALEILGGLSKLNMDNLIKWCSGRQMSLEGGFQGRTNKLVDGCYSFWASGDFPLIKAELNRSCKAGPDQDYLFDREALQEYILLCCQSESGGLIDKPGKGPDYYHTCYCLSGLSTAQHSLIYDNEAAIKIREKNQGQLPAGISSLLWGYENSFSIVGDIDNLLAPTHPVFNISLKAARGMIHYFYKDQIESFKDVIPKFEDPLEEIDTDKKLN